MKEEGGRCSRSQLCVEDGLSSKTSYLENKSMLKKKPDKQTTVFISGRQRKV